MSAKVADVDAIFCAAIEIESPEKRAEFVDRACGADAELSLRVGELLAAHLSAGEFLERPPATVLNAAREHIVEAPGTVIGPYKLLQQIGEGDMGIVFMAEQTRPIQRTVALKIIKPGMDIRQVIGRFEAERQALAMMDHPNIARVLDAGTTGTGRPYFVMDLVKGVPITEYCDQQHITVRNRLELMTQVCHAVQHAHQKGIIHRDLKPSNVLVAEYDGEPVPKIIDFGVAKATAQRLTERTMFTQYGQIVGTFEYMSPEQSRFNQLDVDTRSDIYSLGVLLYELLTGSTPLEKERLRTAAFDEILRIISEEEPPTPSTRLSSSQTLASIAANRQTEATKLSKDIRGELDWIVMKCLEKDRNRRYDSASSLARDIERFLNDEAVVACPPSTKYRVAKFIRRNKIGVLASLAVIASLTLASGLSTWLYFRERDARRNEMQLRKQAEMASKIAETEQIIRVRGVPEAEEHLNSLQPHVDEMGSANEARFYFWLSKLKGRRARWREAAAYSGKAVELDPTNIDYYHYYLPALLQSGHDETYRRVRPIFLERLGTTTGAFVAEQVLKDILLTPWSDMDTARLDKLAAKALEIGQENPYRTWCWFAKGLLEYRKGNYESAIQEMERTVANVPPHSCRHVAYMVMAMAHQRLGETEKARSVLAVGTEFAIGWLPKENELLTDEYWNDWIISQVLMDEASSLILGNPHSRSGESSAVAFLSKRDFASAERAARDALELHRRTLGADHVETGWDLMYLGWALAAQSKNEEAERHLWNSIAIFTKEYGDVHYSNALVFPKLRDLLINNNDLPGMVRLWKEYPVAARLARRFNAGGIVGSFPAAAARGKRAIFSGWIRTEDIEDYAGLWFGASAADGTDLGTAGHERFNGIKGTSDWTKYSVEFDVPEETAGVVFGAYMLGKGTVWFDSFEVELDGEVYQSEQFDFDFESHQIKGLAALHSKSYRTQLDLQVAKTGKQSVRIECLEPVWPPPSP